ncbi:MAG: hypothetical protein KC482_15060 [Dehalococcoidia bacterium]|nr:hypothetical protein [Dehalococcoidia bacterium]MCA9845744.1 hypothetical protein [Dehalococcoidia bacterium]MCA9854880.1 hypothetical protein [Dehalococcoidia bacterium]
MKSRTEARFWRAVDRLTPEVRRRAGIAFRQFSEDPSTRSLEFKKVGEPSLCSVRVTDAVRALGYLEGDTITWFWIGLHDEYIRRIRTS